MSVCLYAHNSWTDEAIVSKFSEYFQGIQEINEGTIVGVGVLGREPENWHCTYHTAPAGQAPGE